METEPLVAVTACRHRTEAVITLASGAELFWAEVTVLGRYGEVGGDVWTRRSVDLAGRPLNRQSSSMVAADRRCSDPAVLSGARAGGIVPGGPSRVAIERQPRARSAGIAG